MRFATINGVVLHYADDGPSQAPTVVFLNSLGTDLRIWDALLPNLSAEYRIIRLDKRGHGLSQLGHQPLSMPLLADDVAGLLAHLGITQAAVVGLSVGGQIAQQLAATRADLVPVLVLCDTAHRIGTVEMWNSRIETIRAGGIEAHADNILQRWFCGHYQQSNPTDLAGWRTMLVRCPVEGYIATCAALRDTDLTASTSRLTQPTLCVVGEEDGSTPVAVVQAMAALIKESRFISIPNAAHMPGIEQPTILAGLIRSHLQEFYRA